MTESFEVFSQALRELLARPEYSTRFMEIETTEEVRKELGITEGMATELKRILAKFQTVSNNNDPRNFENSEFSAASADKLEDKAMETVMSAETFLERSFAQLRTGARVLMLMSVTMFLIGISFLAIAAIRSFTQPESVKMTGVIAGIGIVQIILLLYSNPLRDIRRSISNSQQAKMVVMSYMLGVSLIAKSLKGAATEKEQQALSKLTEQALLQLSQITKWEDRIDGNKARSEGAK